LRNFTLGEGSIYERLRRSAEVEVDPYIFHASLVYTPAWARQLEAVHREYLDVGRHSELPIIAYTDTWRSNQERIDKSAFCGRKVNQDNARFLSGIKASYGKYKNLIFVAGNVGPKGDAYLPQQSPGREEARVFHTPQVAALAEGGVDLLQASTLPAFKEALGIADAFAETDLPYILSFVIRSNGRLLDGTPLSEAIRTIDETAARPPAGYAVNCVHPIVFASGMDILKNEAPELLERIFSFSANTSALDPEQLDGSEDLITEEPGIFANHLLDVHKRFGIANVGGCCGTDASHIAALANAFRCQ
jgi:homocysteine S-methyltransferase